MADGTKIEWTDATLNVVNGCSVISPGCTNCYAMRAGGRNLPNHPATGLTRPSKAGHVWTGEVRFNERALMQPLRWRRPRTIFWNAHGDLFYDSVPDAWIDRCFAVMALTPHHKHQVLTKRSARMRAYMDDRSRKLARFMIDEYLIRGSDNAKPRGRAVNVAWPVRSIGDIDCPSDVAMTLWPLPNVWLGVSVEDQQRADERIPDLLATPSAVRFLSCEPLLGPVDLTSLNLGGAWCRNALTGLRTHPSQLPATGMALDWVIVGGESGAGSRPMHPEWARDLRDQCAADGVPFLFKQWGDHIAHAAPGATWRDGSPVPNDLKPVTYERVGKHAAGRLLDGVQHDGMPV